MDEIRVNILKELHINDLIEKHKEFQILKEKQIQFGSEYTWNRNGMTTYDIQVIFIGKTGYGKSTTINKITGHEVFPTDETISCTKDLYSIEYKIKEDYYFSIGDLPGVGESIETDKKYLDWYQQFLKKSHVVIYMLRADQRDYSKDEEVFKKLFSDKNEKSKVIIGINFIDKIEPINRKIPFILSYEQEKNLNLKIDKISEIFGIEKGKIQYFSSQENFNLHKLASKIIEDIKIRL